MSALANAVHMIEQGAPRKIRTDEELEHYSDTLFELTAKESPTLAELDAIDLLSLLVETYQAEQRTLPKAAPLDILRFLMEHNGLQQNDLAPQLGSVALVSMILAGKRNLTLQHVRALAQRFRVPASVFLG